MGTRDWHLTNSVIAYPVVVYSRTKILIDEATAFFKACGIDLNNSPADFCDTPQKKPTKPFLNIILISIQLLVSMRYQHLILFQSVFLHAAILDSHWPNLTPPHPPTIRLINSIRHSVMGHFASPPNHNWHRKQMHAPAIYHHTEMFAPPYSCGRDLLTLSKNLTLARYFDTEFTTPYSAIL